MPMRVEYQKHIEEQLVGWKGRLDALQANANSQVKADCDRAFAEWNAALGKLSELKAAPGARWGVVKGEMERARRIVAAAVDQVTGGGATVVDILPTAATRITERGMAVVVPADEPPEAA
jgi:hypothetical protein